MGNIVQWRAAPAFGAALCATVVLSGCTTTTAVDSSILPTNFAQVEPNSKIRGNEKTGRPECHESTSVPLGASAPTSHVANATTPWKEPVLSVRSEEQFHLVGVIARDESLFGFLNIDRLVKTGETISLNASQFTVMPDYTESLTKIDDMTLCIVAST